MFRSVTDSDMVYQLSEHSESGNEGKFNLKKSSSSHEKVVKVCIQALKGVL